MNRRPYCLVAAATVLLGGCGPRMSSTEQAKEQPRVAAQPAPAVGDQIELFLYNESPTAGAPDKPRFKVASTKFTRLDDNTFTFDGAHAVIYGKDQEETLLEAEQAKLDQVSKAAWLSGGVQLTRGTMNVKLEDVAWLNNEGRAVSDKPASVTDGRTQLDAARLEYYPDDHELVLHDVTGVLEMKEVSAK